MRPHTDRSGAPSRYGTVDNFGNRERHPKPHDTDPETIGKGVGSGPRHKAKSGRFPLKITYYGFVMFGRKEWSYTQCYRTAKARLAALEHFNSRDKTVKVRAEIPTP